MKFFFDNFFLENFFREIYFGIFLFDNKKIHRYFKNY